MRKGPWSIEEDSLLTNYIQQHGEGQWRSLPMKAGLLRCGKSCRLRWMNYLKPGIKRGNFTPEEEDLIVRLHSLLGNRWSLIAGRLPGRTDNEIKNYWNTHLLKKLKSAGIQPKARTYTKRIPKRTTKATAKPEKTRSERKKKHKDRNGDRDRVEKTKAYAPRPIRVSTVFTRNYSCDDMAASISSNSEEVGNNIVDDNNNNNHNNNDNNNTSEGSFVPWHLHGVEDDLFDDFLDGWDVKPKCSLPINDDLLEKVYDEYLQLLSENCYLQDDPSVGD